MSGFGKFEDQRQFNSDSNSPDKSFNDDLFLNTTRLFDRFSGEFAIFKKTHEYTQEYKEEMRLLIDQELKPLVSELTSRIITETDLTKVQAATKELIRLSALPYMGFNLAVIQEIGGLLDVMDWDKWGLIDQKANDQTESINQNSSEPINKDDRVNLLFKDFFSSYNLDPRHIMSAWRESIFPLEVKSEHEENLSVDEQKKLVIRNLYRLIDLEYERPGAAAALFKDFSLDNFGRYGIDFLLNQYDNIDNQEMPYGLIIAAQRDYNGSSYEDSAIRDLQQDLQGRYLLRATEASGRFGVVRNLVSMDKRYGQHHKISFAMFRGHGNEESIALGNWSDNKPSIQIDIKDVAEAKWLEKIRVFFADNPTIILDSCLCGKKGGLAEKMAKQLKINVIANDEAGGINSIETKGKDDNLDFNIRFGPDKPSLLKKVLGSPPGHRARQYKP